MVKKEENYIIVRRRKVGGKSFRFSRIKRRGRPSKNTCKVCGYSLVPGLSYCLACTTPI